VAILSTGLLAGGFGLLADAATSTTDRAALYSLLTGIAVTTIGGGFAYATSRTGRNEPRTSDEVTTHALPRELADMLVEVIAERDLWKQRAIEAGWSE
jgi:hypothetical protein